MRASARVAPAMLLVLAAAILLLTACADGAAHDGAAHDGTAHDGAAHDGAAHDRTADDGAASGAAAPAPGSFAAGLAPYELRVFYEGPQQADEELVEQALNRLLTERINATIDIAAVDWGAWDDRMNLMIASREEVDVVFTAQWNGYARNVAKGAYLPVDELLASHGQGILASLDPAFLAGSQVGGRNYGVPTNKEMASVGGIVYRADVARELGIDMSGVRSPEDLDAVYAVVKERRPDMVPLYTTGGLFNAHYFAQFDYLGDATIPGVVMKNGADTTVVPAEETDIYRRYLRIARDYYLKGYINSDAATTLLSGQGALKAGVAFSTVEALKPGKAAELANETGLQGKLEQIAMTDKTIATSETAGAMLAVSSTSKDPERAMMFINLLHTDKEVNNLLAFGIEGVHYTRQGEIISATDRTTGYAHGAAWQLGNQFLNYVWDTEDPNKWEQFRAFNRKASVSPALGFVFDSEPVKAEVGTIASVVKQYQKALETGSVDIDHIFPEYMEALEAAGVRKVVAEKQKQFDQFLAAR